MSDIIAAPSTAPVCSALAIIRMSGSGCKEIIEKCFSNKTKIAHAKCVYGNIIDNNKIIDEVMLSYFKAPHSFTGEDTVEISCHGNNLIVKNIMHLLISLGSRIAEPGEFSKRAFLNGKIDLTEAEAINHLICARSDWEIDAAIGQMHGSLKDEINNLREKLLMIKADVEGAIDFSEEKIEFISSQDAIKRANEIKEKLDLILKRCTIGAKISDGIDLPIVGKPNSGKSSLMNLVLNQDRAIVSNIEGTTRDIIRENLQLGGVRINLYDTAGIRSTDNEIEKIGIEKAEDVLKKSQIALVMIDAFNGVDEKDMHIIEMCKGKECIYLINKIDLCTSEEIEKVKQQLNNDAILFSAKKGDGLADLEKRIKEIVTTEIDVNQNFYLADLRITELLENSLKQTDELIESIIQKNPDEIVAYQIQEIINLLSEITGSITADDVLNSIFSRFCIGK